MPWAHNLPVFNHALPQRPAAVQADVVHGRDGAVHVSHADGLIAAGKFSGFVIGGEFGLGGEFGEQALSL